MSGDRSIVEELLMRGADQSLKGSKKDMQGGADLTPYDLAVATKFKHIQVFKKMPKNHNLGRADIPPSIPLPSCNIEDIKVRVTRQDTQQYEVKMMGEFCTFFKNSFPGFDSKHLKFPPGFTYDKKSMGGVDGPTDVSGRQLGANTARERDRAVVGRRGEEMTDAALHKAFGKRTSMLWNDFEQDKLFKIARDCVRHDLDKARQRDTSLLDVPLLPDERSLQELFGIDMTQLEKEVDEFVKEIFAGNQKMAEGDLDKAIDDKCKNPKKTPERAITRPAFDLLSPKEQTDYRDKLKKHVKKVFKKGKKDTTKNNIKDVKPAEFGHYLIRYFMSLLNKQAEFDHILVDKDSSSFIQVEVKTYPQQGGITKEGMKDPFMSANQQLGSGDALFHNILHPGAKLGSSWRKINVMCFPLVNNRQEFRDHLEEPIDDEFLKYVMTKEELENDNLNWMEDLKLGTTKAPTEEYERILAIIVGSAYVGYNSQIFDHQKEIRKVHERVVGARSGVTPFSDPLPEQFSGSDLRNKPLGHIMNIIFWSEEQMQLLEDLKGPGSLVLCGDYGGGKTSVMVSAAQKAARDRFKVFVITTTSFEETVDTGYILDVAMKEKFGKMVWDEEVDLTVTSLMDIHKELGLPFNSSTTDLITKFMEAHGDKEKVKIFFDEFPVSKGDLEAVKKNKEGELTRMLKAIDDGSCQAYVSLKTTCLLDTVFAPGPKTKRLREVGENVSTEDLKSYIERQTSCKVKVLSQRMRNTSKIGKAVVAKMEDYALKHEGTFPVARVLLEGKSENTVPGERPDCVVGELGGYTPNMANIAMCLNLSLTKLLHLPLSGEPAEKLPPHIAILCGDSIQPREVWKTIDYLNIRPCLYDGGVKMYSYATAHHYDFSENQPHPTNQQRANLIQWMEGPGGILVTHNRLFAGMEAPTVVLITKTLGTNETAVRSGMLRAVAKLVVISDRRDTNIEMVQKHFDVTELPDVNADSDSDEP